MRSGVWEKDEDKNSKIFISGNSNLKHTSSGKFHDLLNGFSQCRSVFHKVYVMKAGSHTGPLVLGLCIMHRYSASRSTI